MTSIILPPTGYPFIKTTAKDTVSPLPGGLIEAFEQNMRSGELTGHHMFSLNNRYAYFPMPKAANTTVKALLNRREAAGNNAAEQRYEQVSSKHLVHNPLVGSLLSPFYVLNREDIMRDICLSENFFRFTMTRNPYTRVLSSYLDRFRAKSAIYGHMQRQARTYGLPFDEVNGVSFLEFLRICDAVASPRKLDQHVRPQYNHVHANFISFDAVAKFETMAPDLEKIFDHLFQGEQGATEFSTNISPTVTKAGDKLKSYFCAESIEIVRRIYATDFVFFGYDLELPD